MTDIFEGSIIRLARRLDEFLNQVMVISVSVKKFVSFFYCLLFLLLYF